MTANTPTFGAATLAEYLRLLRRRKWVILAALIAAPAVAYYLTSRDVVSYRTSAQVLLSPQLTAGGSSSIQAPSLAGSPETELTLVRSQQVANQVVGSGKLPISSGELLADTSIAFSSDGFLVTFTATTRDPALAPRIANAYARTYVQYRYSSEAGALDTVATTLQKRLAAAPPGPVHTQIAQELQTIDEQIALHMIDARVLQQAGPAALIPRQLKRNTAVGLALGLVIGVALAFLLEALDTRVRSAEAVEERLGIPWLGRLPSPPRSLRRSHGLAMLEQSDGAHAEAYRLLRTNMEFAMLGHDVRTIMVTSAVEEEGKSTTIANLAVAFARIGQPVTLVDLDLRRPFLHKLFDVDDRPGLTDIVLGHATFDEVLLPVDVDAEVARNSPGAKRNGSGPPARVTTASAAPLHVLRLGSIPPDPGEFIGSKPLAGFLQWLRSRPGLVLIDAPPLFHVGDGLSLSAKVDAVLVVSRLSNARRPGLVRLHRLLESMPARKLGFVVTGADTDDGYGYAGAAYYYTHPHEEPARH